MRQGKKKNSFFRYFLFSIYNWYKFDNYLCIFSPFFQPKHLKDIGVKKHEMTEDYVYLYFDEVSFSLLPNCFHQLIFV